MNPKEYVQQAIKSGQTIFNNTYDMAVLLQDQYEKAANVMLDQSDWLPGDQRKLIDNYTEAYKAGRKQFKSYMDETYKQVENLFQ